MAETDASEEQWRVLAVRPVIGPRRDGRLSMPVRRVLVVQSGEAAVLDLQCDADDADDPDADDEQRQPVEVLLHHCRSREAGLNAATEQGGQTAALGAVQQHQQDHQDAGDDQRDLQAEFHGGQTTGNA